MIENAIQSVPLSQADSRFVHYAALYQSITAKFISVARYNNQVWELNG